MTRCPAEGALASEPHRRRRKRVGETLACLPRASPRRMSGGRGGGDAALPELKASWRQEGAVDGFPGPSRGLPIADCRGLI